MSSTPTAVLTELFNGLTKDEQQERKWRTAIPADTKLMSAVQESDGTLVIDLNQAFFQATSENQIKAVAQIVFSATGIDGVQRVKILVEASPGLAARRRTAQPVGEPLTQYAYPSSTRRASRSTRRHRRRRHRRRRRQPCRCHLVRHELGVAHRRGVLPGLAAGAGGDPVDAGR